MKTIDTYIQERLHINKDTKTLLDDPINVKIDEFNEWLKHNFNYTTKDVNKLKDYITSIFSTDIDYDVLRYDKTSVQSNEVDNIIDESIKLYKDSPDNYPFYIIGEDTDLFLKIFEYHTMRWEVIIIIDKNFNLLHAYLLDIILS